MNIYQKMIRDDAKAFYDAVLPSFEKDAGEHGGASPTPNLAKWLDRTRKLEERLKEVSGKWGRADLETIRTNSKNAQKFGDPVESASLAYLRDLVHELKRLRKAEAKS